MSRICLAVAGTPFSLLVRVSFVWVEVALTEDRPVPQVLVAPFLETEVSRRKEATSVTLTMSAMPRLVVGTARCHFLSFVVGHLLIFLK